MSIDTSTNLISFNRDGSKTEMVHLLPLYAKEGFRVLDLNLCEMLNPNASLAGEQWKEYAERLGQLRHQHTLVFNQAHAPYARSGEILEELLTRALQICHLLGIPILVVHPIPGSIEENHHAFLPYLKAAEEFRVVLAFENLNEEGELTDIADLIALVERFASPFAGICYDTGHANLLRENRNYTNFRPGEPWERLGRIGWDNQILEKVLPYVTSAHLQDNHGDFDVHLAPGHGDINWPHITRLLKSAPRLTTLQCEVSPGHHNYTVADIIASIQKIWGHIHISEDRETMPFTPYT